MDKTVTVVANMQDNSVKQASKLTAAWVISFFLFWYPLFSCMMAWPVYVGRLSVVYESLARLSFLDDRSLPEERGEERKNRKEWGLGGRQEEQKGGMMYSSVCSGEFLTTLHLSGPSEPLLTISTTIHHSGPFKVLPQQRRQYHDYIWDTVYSNPWVPQSRLCVTQ